MYLAKGYARSPPLMRERKIGTYSYVCLRKEIIPYSSLIYRFEIVYIIYTYICGFVFNYVSLVGFCYSLTFYIFLSILFVDVSPILEEGWDKEVSKILFWNKLEYTVEERTLPYLDPTLSQTGKFPTFSQHKRKKGKVLDFLQLHAWSWHKNQTHA